ncbi:ras-related protein rab-37 [Anaeramoeba ignava]|uniref:Ras-related protein rab-37 n=1 Tax=Anaeramoeba ignava TaxID=1746090 RepID=A0A9Q0LLZ4_ANAIG|nr:ras-related protein rab-37 [Anaeramoeba ignava]
MTSLTLKLILLGNTQVGKSCLLQRQERFRSITSAYYRDANAVLVVYDITNRESFEQVEYWINDISKNAPKNVSVTLVGNKLDLQLSRKVTLQEGQFSFVSETFLSLAESAFEKCKLDKDKDIDINPPTKPNKSSCC